MAAFYKCESCGSINIPVPEDLVCIFCLAKGAKERLPKTKEVKVDVLLNSVFPDGV